VQVTIQFPDETLTFEGLSIYASGRKYRATLNNTCECRIYNLTKEQRNYILSRTSPLNNPRQRINMAINVGRESYGTFTLFNGSIGRSSATQPPDIGVSLIALTNNLEIGVILGDNQAGLAQLSQIAAKVASSNGLSLDFKATDKQIANFSYNGSAAYQIRELNDMGDIIASVDNNVLTVVNVGQANNDGSFLVNSANGMVGIPQFTDSGVLVKIMINNIVQLGNRITLQSDMLPAADGDYIVQGIIYDVASRDQQFFYTLDCLTITRAFVAGSL
jgi:hypothetical protein